jgi:glycosyltransferase involved in cell wall biosynthesis
MKTSPRLLRITTVPISLKYLLGGQLTFFQEQGFEVCAVSAEGSEVTEIERESKHKVIPMTREITPLQDLYCLWLLIRLILKLKPDIVHTHTPKAGLLGMIAAWICRVPVRMHTVAGLPLMEAKGFKRKMLELTEKITYACATHVYPNSQGLLKFIDSGFRIPDTGYRIPDIADPKPEILNQKFKIIGKGSSNGIDTTFFSRTDALSHDAKSIRQKHGIAETDFVFSFVGRLVKDKGLVELVVAFQKLNLPSRLLLVGPFEDHLDPLPDEVMTFLKNDSRVILAGFQKDVRPWMMAADGFVFPSYREGFPNVVMQAACLELPVIVSDINGCNELIVRDETGWVVPAKNAVQLLLAMKEMSADKEKGMRMAKKARKFVVANFDRAYVWEELLKEYRANLKM